MTRDLDGGRPRRRAWVLPVVGVSAAVLAATCFNYVAWEYVPSRAFRLAEAVLLFVLGPLVAVVVGVAAARGAPPWLWPAFATVFLGLAMVGAVLCGVMLYGIHSAPLPAGG